MRKLVFICILAFVYSLPSYSQFEMGLKLGVHSIDVVSDGISLGELDRLEQNINIKDANYGFHFGAYTRIKLLGIYIEPGFMFNSSSVEYSIDEIGENGLVTTLKNESYNNFDIPVMIGFKVAFLRLYGGPVAHLHIDSSSDLIDIRGYEARFRNANYGYQAGIGFTLFKLNVDLQYEGNFTKFGDHITIDGTEFSFDDSASRVLLSLGFRLF